MSLHYNHQEYTAAQVARIGVMLMTLLGDAVERPQLPVGALSILASDEKASLLEEFRGPIQHHDAQSLQQLFEAYVAGSPDQIAVIYPQGYLTYEELNRRAKSTGLAFMP